MATTEAESKMADEHTQRPQDLEAEAEAGPGAKMEATNQLAVDAAKEKEMNNAGGASSSETSSAAEGKPQEEKKVEQAGEPEKERSAARTALVMAALMVCTNERRRTLQVANTITRWLCFWPRSTW